MTGRFLRPAIAFSLGLVVLLPVVSAAVPTSGDDIAGCDGVTIRKDDHWAKIASPEYDGRGTDTIVSFDAPPATRNWVYVANERVVKLSIDGGCRWSEVYETGIAARPGERDQPAVIAQVVAPAGKTMWVATYDPPEQAPRPHVYMTSDATPAGVGGTAGQVTTYDLGLPPVGKPISLVVSPTRALSAFLLLEMPPDGSSGDLTPSRHLYALTVEDRQTQVGLPPGPPTWMEITPPEGFGRIEGIAMTPKFATGVWIWSGKNYAMHTIGNEWLAGSVAGEISTIDVNPRSIATVFHRDGDGVAGTQVELVIEPDKPLRLRDAGRLFVPVLPDVATHGKRARVYAISGNDRTYGFDTREQRWVNITPAGVPQFTQLRMASGGEFGVLLGQTPEALYRFDMYEQERFLPPPPPPPGTNCVNCIPEIPTGTLDAPIFTPKSQVVTVAPGELSDAPVQLSVDRNQTPVDVFFIMDTTSSMNPVIADLKKNVKSIAGKLRKVLGKNRDGQWNACFGVGDVKDFNPQPELATRVWRVHQRITCDENELQAGVDRLAVGGGSPPQAEGQLLALHQSVRGDGWVRPPIPRGQDAGFRGEVDERIPFRVIVLLSDADFIEGNEASTQGTYPTMQEAADVLNQAAVKIVNVLALDENDAVAAREDMEAIATLTDSVAPANGVDCNGDGKRDIPAGEPLVCEVDGVEPNLTPAIVNLLLGVQDQGMISADPIDPHRVIVETAGATSGVVNLNVENHLRFKATVTCTPQQDGLDLPVTLVGKVKGSAEALGQILVRCRSIPVIPPEPPLPVEPPAPVIIVVPVIPEIPIPVFNNPVTNLPPNAGLSSEKEEQYQLAGVTQDSAEIEEEEDPDIELAMSSLSHGDAASSQLVFGCAAALMTAAAGGLAARNRRRSQRGVSPSYVRRR